MSDTPTPCVEKERLKEHRQQRANWKLWGPYLSERSWGTVREDYSYDANAWTYFPHEHARLRAYRWGEDGIAGLSDRNQYLCFSPALWNGNDPILKERLFGLSGPEGNHGEDVKEFYAYVDSTPTHSYLKCIYKYPISEYPYDLLVAENAKRGRLDREYELNHTGILDNNNYIDCSVEYAKTSPTDIVIALRFINRSASPAPLTVIPTLWFRNTWSWGYLAGPMGDVTEKPSLEIHHPSEGDYLSFRAKHSVLGEYFLYAPRTVPTGQALPLFTENETNFEALKAGTNFSPYVKDAFHRYIIDGEREAVNPTRTGTKAGIVYKLLLQPGIEESIILRLSATELQAPLSDAPAIIAQRIHESDVFYDAEHNPLLNNDEKLIQRQAFAGLLWSKQLYYYDVEQWIKGDPITPASEARASRARNAEWSHVSNFDLISMPDKWEFPWYASWDLAFHCVSLALVDPDFAKRQLKLMTREWYMHPNGQLPAYEWSFDDANPPVHAWAAWRVYKIDAKLNGVHDIEFLEGVFHKLLLNFTWWVNRKDRAGNNIFQGGFLGLDNIGLFDRSNPPLPPEARLDQADGTSWMSFYCLHMLKIALELAVHRPVYQDSASKFLEHFLRMAYATTHLGSEGVSLWDEEDGFFYDIIYCPTRPPGQQIEPIRIRSVVGLMPLIVVDTLEPDLLTRLPDFKRRLKWFVSNRPHLSGNMMRLDVDGIGKRRILSLLTEERLVRVLSRMCDPEEFLSPYGIRSLSKYHQANPYKWSTGSSTYSVSYEPAESETALFGGNSNWRGPIWFPLNFLIIESLQRFHHYYGDRLKVEHPKGSGNMLTLGEIAADLSRRLSSIFTKDSEGRRACFGSNTFYQGHPINSDHLLFHEYFHADTGEGLGASHQTGWTALVAKLIQQK